MHLPAIFGNQLVNGGLVLMLTGAAMGLLRQVPGKILTWLEYRFTVSITIRDVDPLFEWTKLWLDTLPYAQKAHNVLCSLHREADQEFDTDSRAVFVPGYGDHFFRHNGKFIWLSRNNKEDTPGNGSKVSAKPNIESFTFTILGHRQSLVRELVDDILASTKQTQKDKTRAYISGQGWWRRLPTFVPRKLETVDLPTEDETRIVKAIQKFLTERQEYVRKGIPYHLNFLFEGLPGTGKTSLAAALSGFFGLHLHILNIAGPGMNDDRLVNLMLDTPRRSIILMEDVDCIVPERKKKPKSTKPPQPMNAQTSDTVEGEDKEKEESGVTLSGLMNCMDGLTAPDGAIFILTTNHPENLDPALVRPGRIDIRVKFGVVRKEQIDRMVARLRPGLFLNGAADKMIADGYTTAMVQAELLGLAPAKYVPAEIASESISSPEVS